MNENFYFERPTTDIVLSTDDAAWDQISENAPLDPSPAPPTKKDDTPSNEPPF